MSATFEGSFSRLIRRFAGISLVVAIAACGGGDSPGTGTTVAQASQRARALAAGQTTAAVPAIAGGGTHSLALKSDGTVWAWGTGSNGELGNNSTANSSVPVQVAGPGNTGVLSGVTAIAGGGAHSLALKGDGTVWAWGSDFYGQLGDNSGSRGKSSVPVQVVGPTGTGALSGVTAIAGGGVHSLALKSDGTVWAWGAAYDGVYAGELGNNSTGGSLSPVQVVGPGGTGVLSGVTAISAAPDHSLALKSDGTVWAWGHGLYGQLGNNRTANSSVPVQVVGSGGTGVLNGVTAITAGGYSSVALKSDGTVWVWGADRFFFDSSTPAISSFPVQVAGPGGTGVLSGVTAIEGGFSYWLALKSDGSLWAWGDGRFGQLGNNSTVGSSFPVQVAGPGGAGVLGGVNAISTGYQHSLTLKSDGTIWAWGYGVDGELGNNNTVNIPVPVQVVGPGGGGFLNLGSVGVQPGSCTAAASSTSLPEGGGAVTLTAICLTGDVPSTFNWTGGFASGLTTNPVSGNVTQTTTFSVVASNAGGSSQSASVTVDVTALPPPPPAAPGPCTVSANPSTPLPAGGGQVTLTASCSATGGTPTSYGWSGSFSNGPITSTTNTATGNITQTTAFSVAASNAGGSSEPASISVMVETLPPPPTACANQAVSWTVGTASCNATYPGGQSGTSIMLSDLVGPDTGTVLASCTNGQTSLSTSVCTTTPPSGKCDTLAFKLTHSTICQLLRKIRDPIYFGINHNAASDDQLLAYLQLHETTISALIFQFDYGRDIKKFIEGANSLPHEKDFIKATVKAEKANDLLSTLSAIGQFLTAFNSTAFLITSQLTDVLTPIIQGIKIYKALLSVYTAFNTRTTLFDYIQARANLNPTAAWNDIVAVYGNDVLADASAKTGVTMDQLGVWYENSYLAHRVVAYSDSPNIRYAQGEAIASIAAK